MVLQLFDHLDALRGLRRDNRLVMEGFQIIKIVKVWPSSREIAMESRCSPFTNSIQWSWCPIMLGRQSSVCDACLTA